MSLLRAHARQGDRYTYDIAHRTLTIEDPRDISLILTNDYDTNGRVEEQTQADTGIYEFAFTLSGSGSRRPTSRTRGASCGG